MTNKAPPSTDSDAGPATSHEAGENDMNDNGATEVRENRSIATRFQKGQSGNPKGRPKGSRNKAKILEDLLNEKIAVRDGSRIRMMSRYEVLLQGLLTSALKGDHKAREAIFRRVGEHGLLDKLPEPVIATSLTMDDGGIIADFMERNSGGTDATKPRDKQEPGPASSRKQEDK